MVFDHTLTNTNTSYQISFHIFYVFMQSLLRSPPFLYIFLGFLNTCSLHISRYCCLLTYMYPQLTLALGKCFLVVVRVAGRTASAGIDGVQCLGRHYGRRGMVATTIMTTSLTTARSIRLLTSCFRTKTILCRRSGPNADAVREQEQQ